jgi:predicted permease
MELLSGLGAVVAPVFLISLAGWAWARSGRAFDQKFVTDLITIVGSPCLVFSALTKMSFSGPEVARMAAATVTCLGLFAVVGLVLLTSARMSLRVYLPSLVFPNIGNLGLPVCLFAFGPEGLALAMIYFTLTAIGQFTLGPAMAAGRFDLGALLRLPFLYAVAAALAVRAAGVEVPKWIVNTSDLVAGLVIPLMLLALGVALAQLKVRSLARSTAMSVARLAMGLAGGWAVAELYGLEGAFRGVVIIESAMPVAVFNYLFARIYDNQPEEVAGMVLVSTVLSYLTLPLLVAAVT